MQFDLFVMGPDLMAPCRGAAEAAIPRLSREVVNWAERSIDEHDVSCPS
ncbi:hypothetical protein [Micromonospora sp. NPDC005707]